MIETIDQLYTGLRDVIAAASGVDQSRVILADQGRPPPDPPDELYATYKPVPVRAVGHSRTALELVDATESYDEDLLGADWQDFEATTVTQMDLLISCNFLNEGAANAATRMPNANFRYPILERLYSYGFGWRNCSEIRDLTGVLQAGLQPRYQVDLNIWAESRITDTILRAAGFSLTIEDESGNELSSVEEP